MDVNTEANVIGVLFVFCLIARAVAAQIRKPQIRKGEIVYQEWSASGYSEANLLTALGASRNCVRLVVTPELLIVTSYFPFLLFSAVFDMEHVIPLECLDPVEFRNEGDERYIRLTYRDKNNKIHRLCLSPKQRKAFLLSIANRERVYH